MKLLVNLWKIESYFFYAFNQFSMHNTFQFGPYVTYYYPVWFAPSPWSHQAHQTSSSQIAPSFCQSTSIQNSKKIQSPEGLQNYKPPMTTVTQIVLPEIPKNIEQNQQKKQVQKQQKDKESENNRKEKATSSVKVNRPLTYLTQKSYYMKQKLKGKLKCNSRTLRKRTVGNAEVNMKNKLRTPAKTVATTKSCHKIVKKLKVLKLGQKRKEGLKEKICNLICKHEETTASIPSLIIGIHNLNAFILTKLESLKQRNINRK